MTMGGRITMGGAEWLRAAPKSTNNVASTFFNIVHLLPKGLRSEHGGAKLASCPGRHLTSLRLYSCPLLCLHRRVATGSSGLLYCWSLLRNNTMATNLQKLTLYYGSRCFVAWDCSTHTSWLVMPRDSDMLIAVSHLRLYFVKRSTSESIAGVRNLFTITGRINCGLSLTSRK